MEGRFEFPCHILYGMGWVNSLPGVAKSLLKKTVKEVIAEALDALMGKLINKINFKKSYCPVFIPGNSLAGGTGESFTATEICLFSFVLISFVL